jgi:hypothetical protein
MLEEIHILASSNSIIQLYTNTVLLFSHIIPYVKSTTAWNKIQME